jgi:large subunit ribosomal protein L6
MSRIGRLPITIPAGVTVEQTGSHLKITGSKGTLEMDLMPGITAQATEGTLKLSRDEQAPETDKTYGLMRTLVANMVIGKGKGIKYAEERIRRKAGKTATKG